AGRHRIALPGAASSRARQAHRCEVGPVRQRPTRSRLSAHRGRAQTAHRRAHEVGADDAGDCRHSEPGHRGERIMTWPWRRRAREMELAEELQAHLDMAAAQRIERGESPSAARDNARREFGNTTHVAEVTREMWGGASWDAFVRDARYAARGLRRSPTFAAVAVATFALGIGANTAMFTVVNGALLAPLPFPQPDRLVVLSHRPAAMNIGGPALTDLTFYELRAVPSRAFVSLATDAGKLMTLTGSGDAEQLQALQVT